MAFKRLKLSGFKSFVEPAELRIEPGLTGIVGPNGCGKSNLLEAIRWVMGESSPKSMRGGGMEDVIFAGTADRPQRNFAEVSLLTEVSHRVLASIDSDDGELEVVRRIERGAGSAYRANGRDVRAKDVALIFADAATGAHSPALVSQGKIAAVISAKPAERRQMLEEAAGIAGLHVRRKDAEQKLRATETNLGRLEQILADMDVRAGQLRKQALAAERYRKLSAQIGTAEARLVFARWRDAAAAADAARAEANACNDRVSQAQALHDEAQKAHGTAIATLADAQARLQNQRERANEEAARLATLGSELEAVRQRIADLDRQADRIREDSAREDRLAHDAAEALGRLEKEQQQLQAEITAAEARRPDLASQHDNLERMARDSELELARAHAEQARADAEIRLAEAALNSARTRKARCDADLARTGDQLARLGDAGQLQSILADARTEKSRAEAAVETARTALATIEANRASQTETRGKAEAALSALNAEHTALVRQIEAISRDLASHDGDDQALEQVRARPGYELALAAALGDDLRAAIGALPGDGRSWTGSAIMSAGAAPGGCEALADHVDAPAELKARLSAIFVADSDDGQALGPGQRLVTRDGRVRRWDGFVAQGDGAGAAERLAQRNRLEQLELERPALDRQVAEAETLLSESREALAKLQASHGEAAKARDRADAELREALRALDQAEFAVSRDAERREELNGQMAQMREEAEAAAGELGEAEARRNALPDGAEQKQAVAALEQQCEAVRLQLRGAHQALADLDSELGTTREKRAVAKAETKSWQARSSEAAIRIRDMQNRAGELAEERKIIADRPAEMETLITARQDEHARLSAVLGELQQALSAADVTLKNAERNQAETAEALASAREQRAGAAARAEHQDQRRQEMARLSGERFECPPPLLPERKEFDADNVRDAESEAAEHDRLLQSRERLGAVNLIAADELATLETEMAQSQGEHDELIEAIHRLRGSIGSLNREGRQRLLAAFAAVDGHFQQLFARLFNGGKAHLELVDSDDPLEAGLEIMAQPPGKKLSSLTLLSGGEQALTAVALIFALFLTNPAPICVLDEVDAPLDDANIERFCDLLDHMVRVTDTRYLIVTHNAVTMSRMHRLFGVTMIEKGVSRLVSVDLGGAEELLAAE
ncbi:MAG: AAA family ATPase [Blastomonas sp.]